MLYVGSGVKALVQEASLISSYATLVAGNSALCGALIAGRPGAKIAAALGAGFALREIFHAYIYYVGNLFEPLKTPSSIKLSFKIEPPSKQELETKEEEKKA